MSRNWPLTSYAAITASPQRHSWVRWEPQTWAREILLCSNHEGWLQLSRAATAEMGNLGTWQYSAVSPDGVDGDRGGTLTQKDALGVERMPSPPGHPGQQDWGG